ncbi:MAG: DUF2510 domain-containing protein [Actinomycetota bacterium]|nr:DUF2510 domain-containing protein [Actinomycetota bacterium]
MPLSIVLMLVFGVAAYVQVRDFQQKHGVLPWNGSPAVWGAAVGLGWWLLLIPVVALVLTERSAKKRVQAAPPMYFGGTTHGSATPVGSSNVPLDFAPIPEASVGTLSTVTAVAAPAVPPCWAPDPSGRHQYRWWDGAAWTSSVNTNGFTSTDHP